MSALSAAIVGAAALAGPVIGVFWKFEDIASAELKGMVIRGLKYGGTSSEVGWAGQLTVIFAKVFGERHFSWKCFYRSCLASVFAFGFMFTAWALIRTEDFKSFIARDDFLHLLYFYLIFIPMFNVVPDYFSYMKTRVILKALSRYHKLLQVVQFALIDTFLTILMWFFGFLLSAVVARLFIWPSADPWGQLPANLARDIGHMVSELPGYLTLASVQDLPSLGIYLYASLFVSMWAWVYAVSVFIIRFMIVGLPRILPAIVWPFDVEGHPIRSLGCVAGGVVFLVAFVLQLI
jgi:hypothetical protein